MTPTYPPVYHKAHAHIIAFGGHRHPQKGRNLIASALRALRAQCVAGDISRERLQWERDHFHYVGHPVRPSRASLTVIEELAP